MEVSQSAGGRQREEEAGVGKPSLPGLDSEMFSLDSFYNGLDTWLVKGDWVVAEKALCEGAPWQASTEQGWWGKGLQRIRGEESKKLWQDWRKGLLVELVGDRGHLRTELQIGVGSWKSSVTTEVSWNLVTFLIPKPLVALLSPDPKIRGVFFMGLISLSSGSFIESIQYLGADFNRIVIAIDPTQGA